MRVILEPEVGEETLYYHHGDAHKESVGDAELRLEIEAIISKQPTTDDRLEKIVGQTHLAKLAQERQSLSEPFLLPSSYGNRAKWLQTNQSLLHGWPIPHSQ